ncbi:hypothetical protein I7I51_04996 [Histoplasma capsulatum]|uniref:Uncharacterized protein n=1 Tax=Ajellomyces capsulatus TaxID=5037 RepID=A0A8A1M2A2_AJECA|nr:hypothetical protein I7I51_04996 [Histoplasma capsulatum]
MPQAMKLNGKSPATPPLSQTRPCTPIDESPQHCVAQPPITQEELKDLLEVIREVRAAKTRSSLDPGSEPADRKQASDEDQNEDEKRVRASKIDYKTANGVWYQIGNSFPFGSQISRVETRVQKRYGSRTSWDKAISKYKTIESIEQDDTVDALDEYVFVVREHIDNESKESTSYIDVKSEVLRDILRGMLQYAKGVNLMEDKPSLCEHAEKLRVTADSKPQGLEHLLLLVRHIKSAYAATKQHLTPLLQSGQISYDLLWALFKPGSHVFGEVGIEFGIIKFRGTKV